METPAPNGKSHTLWRVKDRSNSVSNGSGNGIICVVAFWAIEKFLNPPVKRYSSGMYVRLAFAVAAHLEPKILVVDEVLAAGDAAFQKKCMSKWAKWPGEAEPCCLLGHDMSAVQTLCDRAVYLQEGTVKAIGSVEPSRG